MQDLRRSLGCLASQANVLQGAGFRGLGFRGLRFEGFRV